MTHTGGPVPEGAAPSPWPQQPVPPNAPGPWAVQQPAPSWPPTSPWQGEQAWPAAQQWPLPAPPPHRDSTRIMAILALVVAGLALAAVVFTMVAPLLFFGLFAAAAGEGFDEGPFIEGGTTYSGRVSPAADGSVSGPALVAAVVPMVSEDPYDGMAERTTCDVVPHVSADVSVLCRADDPAWYGVVRFTGTDGSFEVITVGDTPGSIP